MAVFTVLSAGLAHVCATQKVSAAENGVLSYPAGVSSTFVGLFPPIPGLFFLNQTYLTPPAGIYGPNGQRLPIPVDTEAQVNATRLIASWPETAFGARMYSQLIFPVVNLDTKAYGQRDNAFGLGNVTVGPIIFNWTLDSYQTVAVGLDIATKLGTYSPGKALNVTNNYWSFQPVLAYRYYDPNGFTFGIGNRFLVNTENSQTQYTSGAAYEADFEVGWTLGKLKLSAAGSYVQQFEDDTQFGSRVVGGNRYRALNIGPALTYDFGPVLVSLNYQQAVLAENTAKSSGIFISISAPLYLPPGAPPIPTGSERAITSRH